jgi:hypothetical protein
MKLRTVLLMYAVTSCLHVAHGVEIVPLKTTNQSSSSWTNNFEQFVKELYECARRCPQADAQLFNNTLVSKTTLQGKDRQPRYHIFRDHVGEVKTTQGEINRMVGAGEFTWQGTVSEIKPAEKSSDEMVIEVPIPVIPPPVAKWKIATKSVRFNCPKADLAKNGIQAGSKLTFSGSLKKDPKNFEFSGITAAQAAKDDIESLLIVSVNPETVKIDKVEGVSIEKK